jgi:hypothetical protein
MRDILLLSHHRLVIGHLVDNHRFQRTNFMLMHMGLVTPKISGTGDSVDMSNLDIQYGTGLVHFYPNLGGGLPPKWQIPYLISVRADGLVSLMTVSLKDKKANMYLQVLPSFPDETRLSPPPLPLALLNNHLNRLYDNFPHKLPTNVVVDAYTRRDLPFIHSKPVQPDNTSYFPHFVLTKPDDHASDESSLGSPPSLTAVDSSVESDSSNEPEGWKEFKTEVRRELEEDKQQRKDGMAMCEVEEVDDQLGTQEQEIDRLENDLHRRSAHQSVLGGGLMTPPPSPSISNGHTPQSIL